MSNHELMVRILQDVLSVANIDDWSTRLNKRIISMPDTSQISLHEQIAKLQRRYARNMPAEKFEQLLADRAEMLRSTSRGASLHVGNTAPDFSLPDAYGKLITL